MFRLRRCVPPCNKHVAPHDALLRSDAQAQTGDSGLAGDAYVEHGECLADQVFLGVQCGSPEWWSKPSGAKLWLAKWSKK